jgi:hypothetical protein
LESIASPTTIGGSISLLDYASNYILQLTVAAGVTLLKLLNSFFARHIDFEAGKQHFHKTIWAIRQISVRQNDLPARLAEVLAQMWKYGGVGGRKGSELNGNSFGNMETDSTLQLKVRCRMSMSLVFDSVWRWRDQFQARGHGDLEGTTFFFFFFFLASDVSTYYSPLSLSCLLHSSSCIANPSIPSRGEKSNEPCRVIFIYDFCTIIC